MAWWLREKPLLSGAQYGTVFLFLFSFSFFFFFFFFFFSFSLHLILSSFCINLNFLIRKSSQMLLNQTVEKVIKNDYSSTETDIGHNMSGYEYSSGDTNVTSSETEACLQLRLRMHTVPNVEI